MSCMVLLQFRLIPYNAIGFCIIAYVFSFLYSNLVVEVY